MAVRLDHMEAPGYVFSMATARGTAWATVLIEDDGARRKELVRIVDGRWLPSGWAGAPRDVVLWTDGAGPWLRCRTVVVHLEDDDRRIDLAAAVESGESLDAVAVVDGEGIVACSRDAGRHLRGEVRRLDGGGAVRWSRSLDPDPDGTWRTDRPAHWIGVSPDGVAATRSLVVVRYEDYRSGLAICHGLDAVDGRPRWSTRPAPVSSMPILDEDTIAIGQYGYGAFRTDAWQRSGKVATWSSTGHLVELAGNRYVAEQTNDLSSPQHWVRWREDGTVERGDRLPDYSMSRPVVIDGKAYFARADRLWCARPDLSVEPVLRFPIEDDHGASYWSGAAATSDGALFVARSSHGSRSQIWRVDLG